MTDVRGRLRTLDGLKAPEQWEAIQSRRPGAQVRIERGVGGRLAAAVVAVAVAGAGTVFAIDRLSPMPEEPASIDTSTWTSHEVATLGLAFRAPVRWHVQRFDELVGHAGFTGAVVLNVDHTFRHPDLGPNRVTSAWDLRGLPGSSVVVSIERVSRFSMETDRADTRRPLRLENARPTEAWDRYAPSSWEKRWLPFVLGGFHDTLQIGIGPEASDRDREIARLIVASIEPLPVLGPNAEERIAFSAYSAGHWQIFSARPDGGERTQLTSLSTDHFHPAWSPDGTRIAFSAQNAGGDMEIHVMNADGSNLVQLTRGPGWSYLPAWSPDASRIVFVSNRDGNDEIYVMDADGSDQTRLTADPEEDLSPVWSPDGTRIAFQSNRRGGNEILVMTSDGTRVRNVTDTPGSGEFDPAWSPDGTMIAFASDRDGNPEIYVMDANGSGVVRLTNDPAHDWSPAWAPDGSRLAFGSDREGGTALYAVGLDGSEPVRLTDVEADACCPAWQTTTRVE